MRSYLPLLLCSHPLHCCRRCRAPLPAWRRLRQQPLCFLPGMSVHENVHNECRQQHSSQKSNRAMQTRVATGRAGAARAPSPRLWTLPWSSTLMSLRPQQVLCGLERMPPSDCETNQHGSSTWALDRFPAHGGAHGGSTGAVCALSSLTLRPQVHLRCSNACADEPVATKGQANGSSRRRAQGPRCIPGPGGRLK